MKSTDIKTTYARALLLLTAAVAPGATTLSLAASYPDTVLADQPAAYFRLEDPTGSLVVTSAVNSETYQANVVYDDHSAFPLFQQPGIASNSASFHLYTDPFGAPQKSHIELPYAAELNPNGPFTAECWARATSWSDSVRCVVGNAATWSAGWWFRQEAGTSPRWLWVQNGGGIYMAGGSISKNEWTHLVVVYDGTTSIFYANGAPTWSSTTVPQPNPSGPLCIGGASATGDDFFDGNVDEVAVYTHALTADQVKLHYEVGRTNIAVLPVAPSIVADPTAASAYAGRTATFAVTASGTTPLSYQWYRENTPMPGKTDDILNFTCAYADNGVAYKVVVTNLYGSVTSAPAALTVMTDLTLEALPASVTRSVGSKAAFMAVPGGALPVTYQWFKGATQIPGATSQVFWLSNVQLSDDQTTYSVRITNPWTSTNTSAATLSVVSRAVTVPITGYAKVVMADDPVAFWRLDESNGSLTAVDAAGSFDGTYLPGPGTITYGATTGIPHETDTAVSVTGKAQVQIPWALELNPPGPFTAELWFQPASVNPPDSRDIATSEGLANAGPHGWLFYQLGDNSLTWVLFSQGWNAGWLYGGPAVQANHWYHAALTYDGTLFHSYLNGNPAGSLSFDQFVPNGEGWTSFGFRFDGNGDGFDGAIDDVAFYNKALTAEQIQAHYNATVKLNINRVGSNVVLSWPFGTLQSSDTPGNGFSDLPTAVSPYTNAIGTTSQFYRVKVQ